ASVRSSATESTRPAPSKRRRVSLPRSDSFESQSLTHGGNRMPNFLKELKEQRWDDHRYYHHSRINQSLHLVSAISFLCAYALAFSDPAKAALIGWLTGMRSRKPEPFFLGPRGYDQINQASHEHKEEIKVGYNLNRKMVLLSIWALSPLPLYFDPTLFGIFEPHRTTSEFVNH